MRPALCSIALLFASLSLAAAPADPAAVRRYAERAIERCPDSRLSVEPVQQNGPANFQAYKVSQQSSDEHCRTQRYLLVSPSSGQTFYGTVIALPNDARPVLTRVTDHAGKLLKQQIVTTMTPAKLPDGLRQISMTRSTPFGSFSYTGYVDASERFLMVGMRGKIDEDPGVTLKRTLDLTGAARRGSTVARTEIIEISDFQCPTCARAHEMLEPLIAKNLGRISYVRLDLPLFETHHWAVSAALAARAVQRVAPTKYWQFVDHVFKNQEPLGKLSFDTFFKDWAEDNEVSWTSLQKIYQSRAERQAVLDQVARAFSVGVASTPTFIVNGQPLSFGDGVFAYQAIQRAINP